MSGNVLKLKPSQKRRAREKEVLRQEILDAARRLFVREGYENVSMRRIAEKIGYSPTTIYLYFEDKSDLVFALCEETFAKLVQEMQALEKTISDPVARLKAGLHTYVDFGLRYPNHYTLTFIMPHQDFEDHEKYLSPASMGMKAFSFLGRGIAECMRQGKFRPVDVAKASQALWAAMHGVTSLLIVHRDFPWVKREELIEAVLDAALENLKADPFGGSSASVLNGVKKLNLVNLVFHPIRRGRS
ncbi:MAG: TetR/AcrR family transcriptional regulator [Acidobacteria bacterium]|nr:TetR/AcrR family transcriptional regulator [Acidobacteriota bacterium]